MADLKTKPNDASVDAFLSAIVDEARRQDCLPLLDLMKRATGLAPKMWGSSIVGFGTYHYRYASGREGDWFLTGFSPRKRDLSIYIMAGLDPFGSLLARLGKYKAGTACLYIKRLSHVDLKVLEELVAASVQQVQRMWG